MLNFILTCLYLMLPAFLANMMPVMMKNHLKWLAKPIDFNIQLNNQPLFGSHKTFRGFVVGIAAALVVAYLQKVFYSYPTLQSISYLNYNEVNIWLVGFLLGFGALFGDLVKSFVKRRLNKPSGSMFFPWDQLDSWIGAMLFISLIKSLTLPMILFYILVIPLFHLATNYMGYKLKLKEVMW